MASIFGEAASTLGTSRDRLFDKEVSTAPQVNEEATGVTSTHAKDRESTRTSRPPAEVEGKASETAKKGQKLKNKWKGQAEGPGGGQEGEGKRINQERTIGKGKKHDADTDERLRRTVFVGNIPARAKRKHIRAHFEAEAGKVESVRMRSVAIDPEGKMPKYGKIQTGRVDPECDTAIAYVVFESEGAVERALRLNATVFQSRHIRVDKAAPPSTRQGKVEYERDRTVFVGQIPFTASDEDIYRHFSGIGTYPELDGQVEAVRHVRDRLTGRGKGVAYVLYKTKQASRFALSALDQTEMNGRSLTVQRPKPSLQRASKSSQRRDAKYALAKAKEHSSQQKRKRSTDRQGETDKEAKKQRMSAAPWEGARTKPSSQGLRSGNASINVERVKREAASGSWRNRRSKTKNRASPAAGARVSGRKRPTVAARKRAQKAAKASA